MPAFLDMPLLNRSRLSIQPVLKAQWSEILKLAGADK
jgi:predicted RNA-binding protein with PUA-like domain